MAEPNASNQSANLDKRAACCVSTNVLSSSCAGLLQLRAMPSSCLFAAFSGWNRAPMRAAVWMPKKRADLVGDFRRQDVFELARLLLDLFLVLNFQRLGEQALCKTMAANYVGRALLA